MDIRKRLKRGTAMLLVCSVASLGMTGVTLTADAAFAGNNGNKGGNSANAGGGNKGGNSASAKSGGGQSNRDAKAAEREARKLAIQQAKDARAAARAAKAEARAAAKTARAEAKASGEKGNGNLNAKLGALHAARANENAFLHASDNSRIGKLRAYREAKVGAGVAQYEFDTSINDLPEGYEFADADEALAAYDDAAAAKTAYEDAAAAVEAAGNLTQEELEGLGYGYVDGDGNPLEGEDLENALNDDRATEQGLAQDAYNDLEYTNSMGDTFSGADGEAAAQTEVDDLQPVADAHEDLETAEADALAALLEAANKDKHLTEDQLQDYYDMVTPWVDEELGVPMLIADEIAALDQAAEEEGEEEAPSD